MSLYELMICSRDNGGCGHARHRHTRGPGSSYRTFSGSCRAEGSEGRCPCSQFKEKDD